MKRAFWLIMGISSLVTSCTQRSICPAYQSAFIYDKEELRKKFSYFKADSTPKIYTVSKTKYLIAEPVSYQRKVRSLQTVAMKPVMVNVPDSLSGKKSDSVSVADLDRAARSVIDSTFVPTLPQPDTVKASSQDSIYVISKDKEVRLLKYDMPDSLIFDPVTKRYVPEKPRYYIKEVRYNLEQNHYMWYLRRNLVLPDVKIAQAQKEEKQEEKSKKGLGQFFKNLFKKKPKAEVDSTAADIVTDEDEFDFIDEADSTSQAETPQPEQSNPAPAEKPKKSLFKKKSKKQTTPVKQEAKPEEKKEEDDDGF